VTYVWKCPECGDRQEYGSREPQECPLHDDPVEMIRDYRAEGVGIDLETLRRSHRT